VAALEAMAGGTGNEQTEKPLPDPGLDFTANPDAVAAVAEATRLSFGHLASPTFATEVSLIDPLPHQRVAVYEHLLAQWPIRFLLADDAGAGKTEVSVNAGGKLGPVLTLTNTGGAKRAAAAVEMNTFDPPAAAYYYPSTRIEAVDDGNYGNDIVFSSNNPGAPNNLVERMRLSPSGVGIGTASPLAPLHLASPRLTNQNLPVALIEANSGNNTSPRLGLVDTSEGSYQTAPVWFIDNSQDNFRIFRQPNMLTAGEAFVIINNQGSVGFGTASPLAPLHLASPTLTNQNLPVALIEANSGNNTSPRLGFVDTSQGSNQTAPVWFVDNSQDNFRIFRQPNVSTGGEAFVTINNQGAITIPGDIILTGADCAEQFDVEGPALPEPGTVVVIDEEESLGESRVAYDKKVAGVVSGAGSYRCGLLLDGGRSVANRIPVALTGKVYCKVDAQYAPIAIGDLLTTSPTPGHAMKAVDSTRAFGSRPILSHHCRMLLTAKAAVSWSAPISPIGNWRQDRRRHRGIVTATLSSPH
jgi:hypothetical protein